MTSLVAILNNQAVALAADSAVTTSGYYGQKIFNTVNKLFTLSKYEPVGVMVYSSAEIFTIPIETVIKSYRQKLDDKSFLRLEDYCEDFIAFLETEDKLFPESVRVAQANRIINVNLAQFRDSLMRRLTKEFPDWGEPTRVQVKRVAQKSLQEHYDHFHASSELPGVTLSIRKQIRSQIKGVVDYWSKDFKTTFQLTQSDLALLPELALDLLLREASTGVETGFVISGFGQDDYVPQLRSFELESSLFGIHKLREKIQIDVSQTGGAAIVPFAQTEMVETFVQGRANALEAFLLGLIDTYFAKQKRIVSHDANLKEHAAELHQVMDQLNSDMHAEIKQELDSFTQEHHIGPVIATVNAMPKEELAVMAEALINLTSIKRRMSPNAETVGGPTDVAVISKGDGFVWIKRKHYFQPELNPGFGYNYFKKGG